MTAINSVPLYGYGSWPEGSDFEDSVTLHDTSPIVNFVDVPEVQSPQNKWHFWWTEDLSLIGFISGTKAIAWDPKEADSYVLDLCYPTRFSGYCGVSVLSSPLDRHKIPTALNCIRLPYSGLSLVILLKVASQMSKLGLGPVDCVQWSDY
jgi:hypothetical protein